MNINKTHILVVEKESDITDLGEYTLETNAYKVTKSNSGVSWEKSSRIKTGAYFIRADVSWDSWVGRL